MAGEAATAADDTPASEEELNTEDTRDDPTPEDAPGEDTRVLETREETAGLDAREDARAEDGAPGEDTPDERREEVRVTNDRPEDRDAAREGEEAAGDGRALDTPDDTAGDATEDRAREDRALDVGGEDTCEGRALETPGELTPPLDTPDDARILDTKGEAAGDDGEEGNPDDGRALDAPGREAGEESEEPGTEDAADDGEETAAADDAPADDAPADDTAGLDPTEETVGDGEEAGLATAEERVGELAIPAEDRAEDAGVAPGVDTALEAARALEAAPIPAWDDPRDDGDEERFTSRRATWVSPVPRVVPPVRVQVGLLFVTVPEVIR